MNNLNLNTLRIFVAVMTVLLTSCTTHPSDPAATTSTISTTPADTSRTTAIDTSATHTDTSQAKQPASGQTPPAEKNHIVQAKTPTMLDLSAADNDKTITVKKGQRIQLTLRNPGDGGYAFNEPELNASLLKLESHVHNAAPKNANPGNYGNDVWIFSAIGAGQADLIITASRSWEKGKKSTSFSAKLRIQ